MLFITQDSALERVFNIPSSVYEDYLNQFKKKPNTTPSLIMVRQLHDLGKAGLNTALNSPTTKIYTEVE